MEYSRAKAISGGWVYGYPVIVPELPYPPETTGETEEGASEPVEPVMIALMFPMTVDSYTGAVNWSDAATRINAATIQRHIGTIGANGVDVYEGDIITANCYPYENWISVLTWDSAFSTFMLKYYKKKGYSGRDIFGAMVEPIKYLITAKVDIIGNTVDNADLL